MREDVLCLAHEGHQGIVKTKNCLRAKVWWPKMDAAAEKLCRSCHGCQVVSEFCVPVPMHHVELPTGPWKGPNCIGNVFYNLTIAAYLIKW